MLHCNNLPLFIFDDCHIQVALSICIQVCNNMNYLSNNIEKQLDYFQKAPYLTPVKRLNETKANRELDVKWKNEI